MGDSADASAVFYLGSTADRRFIFGRDIKYLDRPQRIELLTSFNADGVVVGHRLVRHDVKDAHGEFDNRVHTDDSQVLGVNSAHHIRSRG